MPKAFTMYRIVCTITGKALISGSYLPHNHRNKHWVAGEGWVGPFWYERGTWSETGGQFWRGKTAVRKHLQNLCYDWDIHHRPPRGPWESGPQTYYRATSSAPDWSRLQHLSVEEITVTDHTTTTLAARDFMGIQGAANEASAA